MTKDYASRAQRGKPRGAAPTRPAKKARPGPAPKRPAARPSRQHGSLSLRWILSLALVGGFVGFIVYLNTLPVDRKAPEQAETAPSPTQEETASADSPGKQPAKESFEFYEMLPESEVVPPDVEAYQPGPSEAKDHYKYVVQAGSFRGEKDAERQRAEIAFQGLRAHVKKITLDSGTVWYRVSVGPFESRSKMNSALDRLVSIDIQPLVRKVPEESDSG